MKQFIKKIFLSVLVVLVVGQIFFISNVNAYVSVRGHTKSNGTYVAPHVRSNPNGLKYDNYSWTPSQGLYNKTYGTRGATWDTPTYITDPEYYTGKILYENNSPGNSNVNTNNNLYIPPKINTPIEAPKPTVQVPANAQLNYYGNGWTCNNGYYKSGNECAKVQVPANAHLNYYGNNWDCDNGYYKSANSCFAVQMPVNAHLNYYGNDWVCDEGFFKSGSSCVKVQIPSNAHLDYWGTGWVCDSGYYKSGDSCLTVQIPTNAHLDYWGSGWVCDSGYYKSGNTCQMVQVPTNAHLDYWGSGWVCDSGYYKSGNACIIK